MYLCHLKLFVMADQIFWDVLIFIFIFRCTAIYLLLLVGTLVQYFITSATSPGYSRVILFYFLIFDFCLCHLQWYLSSHLKVLIYFVFPFFFHFLCNNIKMTLRTGSLDLSHNWSVPSHCNTCAINFFRISFIVCYWCMHFFYVSYVIDAMRAWHETQLTFSKTSKTSEYEFFPSFFFFFYLVALSNVQNW